MGLATTPISIIQLNMPIDNSYFNVANSVRENTMLTVNTKMNVYQACVLRTLCLVPSLGRNTRDKNVASAPSIFAGILSITPQDRLTRNVLPAHANSARMTRLYEKNERQPNLLREYCLESLPLGPELLPGRPALRYKDVCR